VSEPNFDLAWRRNGTVVVAEVKRINADKEGEQLRLGLGQVLRYRQRQPRDPSWYELCQELGVALLSRNELEHAPALDTQAG
jgi:hypothetical protein